MSLFVLMGLAFAAYLYCSYRDRLAPPLIEVIVNCLLLVGIALATLCGLHVGVIEYLAIPLILFGFLVLLKNHKMLKRQLPNAISSSTSAGKWCDHMMGLPALERYPILLILCVPLLALFGSFMMLFGQRPESFIRAFTDTYHLGLSQLDGDCLGVICPGHFLCTIAAKGNPALVKPLRMGLRWNVPIICNRQLLISNAFEEVIQERWPRLHRFIRSNYNRVGSAIHRHYHFFNHRWVSNIVYILMKPLEWAFLIVLYCTDRNPEIRINRQYR